MPPAPAVAEETDRLLSTIVIGIHGIDADPGVVGNWWWKRPGRTALPPLAVSLDAMPMLELVRAAAERLLGKRTEGWPLGFIARTGATVLQQLIGGVNYQLTRVHADDATGEVPSAHERSLALWKVVAKRRMQAVFYQHFVHRTRRMAWATQRIVLDWRRRTLARAARSHAYALSIHQHSFMTANIESCKASGCVATRAEMERVYAQTADTATMHKAVVPSLIGLYKVPKLSKKGKDGAVYSVVHALLRSRELSDSIHSTPYIREQLEFAQKRWARYYHRDDGGGRWRRDRWRWNDDCKWKPAPEPQVCWGCGKQECKRRAEQRAWDDNWDGGHAVRVALRLGRNGDPSGVLAVLRPVPVLKLGAVEREGDVVLRPFADPLRPEPFAFKMRLCPCPRCEQQLERGARARYHDVACQSADWPRHKRGAGPIRPRAPAVFTTRS